MNKIILTTFIIFNLSHLIFTAASDEKINEALPLLQKFYKPEDKNAFGVSQENLSQKLNACFSALKNSQKSGSGIIGPSKSSENLDEIKGILIDDLTAGIKKSFSDIESQENLSSLTDENMLMVRSKTEELLESRIRKFAAILNDNLKSSLVKMLTIHKENEAYLRSSFQLNSIFEIPAQQIVLQSFKILDIIHVPENLKGYNVEQSWWARFVYWLKSLFGFQPNHEPTKEYKVEKQQKYAEYAQNKLYAHFVSSDVCYESYNEIYDLIHNFYNQVELAASIIVLKYEESPVKDEFAQIRYLHDSLSWMLIINQFTNIGIKFKKASSKTIDVFKRIGKSFQVALDINVKTTAENLKDKNRITLWKVYWAFLSHVSIDSAEVALKIMKNFWAACGMKFGNSAQKENLLAAQKLANYVEYHDSFNVNVYSYLFAAICLHLPDNEELEVPINDFDKLLNRFATSLELRYLPRQLISGNSKLLYAPIILAKEGFVLEKIEDLLEKDLLFDADEPFDHVDGFGARMDHDLDNIALGSQKFGNSKQIYVVAKLINLWATNDKNDLPSGTVEMPRGEWDIFGWRAKFTDMDSKLKLINLVDSSLKSQGKNFDPETLGTKDLKQMVSHVFTWEEMREVEPELAALLDVKQQKLLIV